MSLEPIISAKNLYVDNLQLQWNGASITIDNNNSQGAARDKTNKFDLIVDFPIVISSLTTGINGIDIGTVANNTWYAVHLIGDELGDKQCAGILSLSGTNPVLPYGYNSSRRIGWVRYLTSSFLRFTCVGNSKTRDYRYQADTTALAVLLTGHATTYTTVSLASFVPTGINLATIECFLTPAVAGDSLFIKPGGDSAATYIVMAATVVAIASSALMTDILCNSSQVIDYKLSNGGDTAFIYVLGFKDNI